MSEGVKRLLRRRLELARQIQEAYEMGDFGRVAELRREAAEVHRAICEAEARALGAGS